jgi:phosphoglycerate dehydrogenase-like enzyme
MVPTSDNQASLDHSTAGRSRRLPRGPAVRRLRGRTFGAVGLGRIGVAVAIRAKAFGMKAVAYDPHVSRRSEIAVGVDRVESPKDPLAVSDVVSLHCPLTDERAK